MLVYDPSIPVHKWPRGAVVPGTPVSLSVILPMDYNGFYPIYLSVKKDGSEWSDHTCLERGKTKEGIKVIGTTWTAPSEGLYFYKFYAKKSDGSALEETAVFQQTVYSKNFMTPDWLRGALMYQIFPDRFRRSGKRPLPTQNKAWVFRENWGEEPVSGPDAQGIVQNNDFFGGDLKGIEEELPYLASLGVDVLYLNPIFQAYSNHRYDTADYERVDPLLGTEEDFSDLCRAAKDLGMRVVLDGVFNHTGSHSRYFNKDGAFDSLGAFQSKDSPYYNWYAFRNWPQSYDCWWGIDTLPHLREEEPAVLDYLIRSENSVVVRWLRAGASGFRLDVADELPDGFLDALRTRVKEIDPEACVIGEIWEDASNKVAYGYRRRYLQGDQLDTVMNYPLKDGILGFLNGIESGESLALRLKTLEDHYPEPAFMTLMNILGTHDTPRIRTVLKSASASEEEAGEKLFAALLIWAFMPGVACIYYGDEIGMEGGSDPANRRCFQPEKADEGVRGIYEKILAFRKDIMDIKNMDLCEISGDRDSFSFCRRNSREELRVFIHRGRGIAEKAFPMTPDRIISNGRISWSEKGMRMEGPSGAALYFRKI